VEPDVSASSPGPLAEEAARLVEAIGEWARGAVGDGPLAAVGEGPECQVCPLCQLIALVRRTQPETYAHLVDAATSMVAALRSVVDHHDHNRPARGVERIDLE
jgi:adenine-specific DNA glycosylase